MVDLVVKDGVLPSQQIIADANRVVKVTDARGRSIGIRKVTTSIRRRVSLAMSSENQTKSLYVGQVFLAAAVCEIDGENVNLPQNDLQFGALIDRLDDDGFEAVSSGYQENFSPKEEGQSKAGE